MLTIIAVTWPGHDLPTLRRFVSSLQCQNKSDEWNCQIYCDGVYPDPYITDKLDIQNDSRFTWIETEHKGYWGHPNRIIGMNNCQTEYLHWTNADNVYMPIFIEDVLNSLKENPTELLLMPIIHNYAWEQRFQVLNPTPVTCNVDFMSFVIKTELAIKVLTQLSSEILVYTGLDGKICEKAVELGSNYYCIKPIIGAHL